MKKAYIDCLRKIRQFRKSLTSDKDVKIGKLYFYWLKEKTEKVMHEKDDMYLYNNIVKNTLGNFKIDNFSYKRANKTLKKVIENNYILKKNYHIFNNPNISFEDTMLIARKFLFRRGNVVWLDFGFNIGNEFGGIHPAVILKNFDKDIFVVPVSSKKPIEYEKIEKDFEDGIISAEECKERKEKVTEVVQLDNIVGYRKMTRWANITRIRKVSLLRVNFSGTIGRVNGKYIAKLSEKIGQEF